MSLTAEQFDKWVAALRSGEYEQGRMRLQRQGRYCCLGVLCTVQGFDLSQPSGSQSPSGARLWGESSGTGDAIEPNLKRGWDPTPPVLTDGVSLDRRRELAAMNDAEHSFDEIADHLEAHRDEFVEAAS